MKPRNRLWITSVCVVVCLLGAVRWLHTRPVHAQQQTGVYDDGTFYITAFVDVDSTYTLYVASYMLVEFDDYEDIDEIEVDGYADEDGGTIASDYSDGDDYDPAAFSLQSNAPVATGHEYGMESDGLACFDDGEGDEDCEYVGLAYAAVNVASPPATVTGISPSDWIAGQSYTGVQITGTNFGSTPAVTLSDSAIQITRQAYNTSTSSGTSTTYIDISVPSDTPSEPVTVTVAPGSNGNSFTSGSGGSLSGSSTADVIGAQQNACPNGVDANSGFSSISPSGLATGGNGLMTVSFSHGSFNGFGVTVPYGPYSTPESIASHLAALITKQYHSSGLYAQSFGSYILYKSNTTLGTAALTASGSSFAADPAPAACPPVNLKYILAVTTDSVVWTAVQNSGQRGRQLTYVLINKPTADIPVSSFQRVNPPNSITEYLTANGYSSSSNPNTGEFDDVLGNNSLCNCNSGVFNTYRYFTATVNGQALGTVPIYDQTGAHKQDYIQITFPSGPSILNHWTNPDGTPKDISLP